MNLNDDQLLIIIILTTSYSVFYCSKHLANVLNCISLIFLERGIYVIGFTFPVVPEGKSF